MKLLLLLYCVFASAVSMYAQKETTNWYFGDKAGLTFRNGIPEYLTDGKLATSEGCATVSDPSTGNLLFYTDGNTVWSRDHRVMQNGTNLNGGVSSTQSALIVTHPSDKNIYYIFTAGDLTLRDNPPYPGLWYSVVDISRSGGRGTVTKKNIRLTDSTGEKVDATLHCNGSDIWVVTQHVSSGQFYSILF